MYLSGDTLTEHITLTGADMVPILDATFPQADRFTADPNGAPFPAVVTEIGQGIYKITYTLPANAAPGEWFIKLRADDPYQQVFVVRWEVMGAKKLYLPGDSLTYTFVVLDVDNQDVLGATFPTQYRVIRDPAGNTFNIDITEYGQGVYRLTAATGTGDSPGKWFVKLTDDQLPANVYEAEWQVLSKKQASVVFTPSFQGYTRRELRRMVMAKVGDLVLTTATANTGSSTWVDDINLVGEAGTWAGREMLITAGTPGNVGQVRYVSKSSRQNIIQFAQGLPFPVFAGDEAEILNTRGGGWKFQQVHQALNHCLAIANVQVPIAANIEGAFDLATRSFAIPSEFNELHLVQYKPADDTSDTGWINVQRGKTFGDDGWSVDHANRAIVISGRTGRALDGATLRIYGLGKATPLVSDDDMVDVSLEWLTNAAAAYLLLQAIGGPRSMTPEWERKGSLFQQTADQLIDRTRPRRKPNSVKI